MVDIRTVVTGVILLAGLGFSMGASVNSPLQAQSGAYTLAETWESVDHPLSSQAWAQASGLDLLSDGRIFFTDRRSGSLFLIESEDSVQQIATREVTGLEAPEYLAADETAGRLYISDAPRNEVGVFDFSGQRLATWPDIGDAAGVALLADGRIAVASGQSGEIHFYDPDGTRQSSIRIAPQPRASGGLLEGIDAGPDGLLYIADGRSSAILIHEANGRRFGTQDIGRDDLSLRDVAIDFSPGTTQPKRYMVATSGGLYFRDNRPGEAWFPVGRTGGGAWGVDTASGQSTIVGVPSAGSEGSRIMRLPPLFGFSSAPDHMWGVPLYVPGNIEGPEVVAVGSDGRSYILDHGLRIQRYVEGQGFDLQIGLPSQINPSRVDADAQGRVYASTGVHIRSFEPDTGPNAEPDSWRVRWNEPVVDDPMVDGLVADLIYSETANAVIVLDSMNHRLRYFSADGQRGQEVAIRNMGPTPLWAGLAEDQGGRLYAFDRNNLTVHLIESDGRQRQVGLPHPARQITAGADGQFFSLNREGWVRRYRVIDLGASPDEALFETAFDASRLDLVDTTRPTDLDTNAAGDVLVSDRVGNVISRFSWDDTAQAETPPESGPRCKAFPNKTASPEEVDLGDLVEIRLSVRGACGSQLVQEPRDIMLILDISPSMAGEKLGILREAALGFAVEQDFNRSRMGVVTFGTTAQIRQGLTTNSPAVMRAIAGLRVDANSGTELHRGIDTAFEHWRSRRRQDLQPTFILISDGGSNIDEANRAANRAKGAGIEIYTVGIRAFNKLMREVASDEDHYFATDNARFLYGIFEAIAERVRSEILFKQIAIRDELPADMRYVPDSAEPPANYDAASRTLAWDLVDVPPGGVVLRFQVEPLRAGPDQPTNVRAWADYIDTFDASVNLVFPVPQVSVIDPNPPTPTITPTPTSSPTPSPTIFVSLTPSPSPVPQAIFLPLLLSEDCEPTLQHADVVLVLDTSNSMRGTKLQAAKDAAKRFVSRLGLPLDQAAVIGFGNMAQVAHGLTGDAAALAAAIDALDTLPGTRMDRGLELAIQELASERHRPDSTSAIVLLTDGRQDQEPDTALARAEEARQAGYAIFAIGLGQDVDADFLTALTGRADRRFLASSPSDLDAIYTQIAFEVPCPAERFWAGR